MHYGVFMYRFLRLGRTLLGGAKPLLQRAYHNDVKSFQGPYPGLVQALQSNPIYHQSMDDFKLSAEYQGLTDVMSSGSVPKYGQSEVTLTLAQEVLTKLPDISASLREAVLPSDVLVGVHGTCLYSYAQAEHSDLAEESKSHQRAGRDGCFHVATGGPRAINGAMHYANMNIHHRDTTAWQYLFKQSYLPHSERNVVKEALQLSLLKDTHYPEAVILLVMYQSPAVPVQSYADLLAAFKRDKVLRHPLKLQNNPNKAHKYVHFDTEVVVPAAARPSFKTLPVAIIGGDERQDFNTKKPTSLSSQRFFAWPSIEVREGDNPERRFDVDKGFFSR